MLVALRRSVPPSPAADTVMDHFGFKVCDIEPILESWRSTGYEVESEFTGAEGFPTATWSFPTGSPGRASGRHDAE